MTATAGKKRQYHRDGGGGGGKKYGTHTNPKRGGPGILFTSETGRERKCQNEGLDILQHYLLEGKPSTVAADDGNEDKKETKMSLEDELKSLKESNGRKKKKHHGFAVYDTGCRGTVFVLCTLQNSQMIPTIPVEKSAKNETNKVENDPEKSEEEKDGEEKEQSQDEAEPPTPEAKKPKIEEKSATSSADKTKAADYDPNNIPWDPIKTVRTVIDDLRQDRRDMPSSRYVTRMIPIQATCFASNTEIMATAKALVDHYIPANTKTFAISTKRRNCSNVTRNAIIDGVASIVMDKLPECKVDLDGPEITIVVEVCKTLCGMSVVANCKELQNFNVIIAREGKEETTAAAKTGGEPTAKTDGDVVK